MEIYSCEVDSADSRAPIPTCVAWDLALLIRCISM
jgi:hypothetical protein